MDFLKKHYEKIILAMVMLAFLGTMIYLRAIVQDTTAISKRGFEMPTKLPDFEDMYKKENINFDFASRLNTAAWEKTKPRKANGKFMFSSDLLDVPAVARCGHCERLIPFSYFDKKKCPFEDCASELIPPPEVEEPTFEVGRKTKDDPDGCGIPHTLKTKIGLSTEEGDRENVLDDLDGDGFSNLYEYRNKTAMNDARRHPPMWHRLVLVSIEKDKLPIVYKAVNRMNSDDQKKWYFQINHLKNDRLSDTFRLGGRIGNYRIDNVEYKLDSKKLTDPNTITLVPVENKLAKPIVMEMGKDVFSPEPQIFLRDISTDATINTKVGRLFAMGNSKTIMSWYRVRAFDREKNQVFLSLRSGRRGNYRFTDIKEPITLKSKIPTSERIRNSSTAAKPDVLGRTLR